MNQSRRKFLKTTALATAGIWVFGGELALGQIPWEDDRDSIMAGEDQAVPGLESRKVFGEGLRTDSPAIAIDGDRLLLVWLTAGFETETLLFTSFENGSFGEERVIAEGKNILHPTILHHRKLGTVVSWSEKVGERWIIKTWLENSNSVLRHGDHDGESSLNWHPALAADDDSLTIVYEQKTGSSFRIAGDHYDGKSWSPFIVSDAPGNDCRRPTIAIDQKGTAHVAWDQASGPGGSTIWLQQISFSSGRASAGDLNQITTHPAFNHAPSLGITTDGDVWVSWHTNRCWKSPDGQPAQSPASGTGENQWDIPRWVMTRCLRDGKLLDPLPHDPSLDPAIRLRKEGTDQSFEFPRLVALPGGGLVVLGRASHNFIFEVLGKDGWSDLYRLPADGWGGRGQFLHGVVDQSGGLWVVRRDIGQNMIHRITGLEKLDGKPGVQPVEDSGENRKLENIQHVSKRWPALENLEGIDQPLLAFYGDLHGHTWTSDGVGDVDEYYRIRKENYEDDFASLTDHDTFVRQCIPPSGFEYQKELTDHYHDENFVTFFGQEYTTGRIPAGMGHKCIYDVRKDIPLYDHTNPEFDSTPKINSVLRERSAIWVPHHTGWLGTDWELAEDDVQPLVEIVSVHGCFEHMGNRPIQHRGGMKGSFVQDALAAGHRIGIIGGSDCHGLIWHHRMSRKRDAYRTGLAVFLAESLTREALFDAMKKRRCYGTTGTKPMLDFRVNNHIMGSEITVDEPRVSIKAKVMSREDIVYLSVIKNNKVWYEYGGGDFNANFTVVDEDLEPGTHWYYLRVQFDNDEMAWSSPVWVTV